MIDMATSLCMDMSSDRQLASAWAQMILAVPDDWCILDTETTGFSSTAEIVQIGVVSVAGEVLLDRLVKPTVNIDPQAEAVHGLSLDSVADAETFDRVFLPLWQSVGHRTVLIYNISYDLRLIRQSLAPYGYPLAFPRFDDGSSEWLNGREIQCAMQWYSQWVGEPSLKGDGYKWQKLPAGDHSAVGDCHAVINVLRQMSA